MSTPTHSIVSHTEGVSPSNATEQRDEDAWSAEEDADADGDDDDPRKRKRARTARPMSVSCELCKTRKVKCDRGHPQCGWCVKNSQACEYKERKKPGLRAGYGRELESRLDQLEGALQTQGQALQTQGQALQQLADNLPRGPTASGYSKSPAQAHHVPQVETALFMQTPNMYPTAAPVGRRSNGFQSQNTGDMSQQQQPSFLRHASQQSMHIPLSGSPGDGYAPTNPPLQSPSLNISSASQSGLASHDGAMNAVSQDQDFPPYDLLYALTDLFFKHINTWCPILHRRTTLDSLFGSSTLDEADRILLHAIVATTLRFSTGRYCFESPLRCAVCGHPDKV